ncbi:penicillin binding protein PBP4B [Peribacillus loiseleuriae]|uniref:penicillin binding protein PBP4B n=1 Tax=Peribacillus loiseleuriae TaxID=1679170 RepID=UPI003D06F4A9
MKKMKNNMYKTGLVLLVLLFVLRVTPAFSSTIYQGNADNTKSTYDNQFQNKSKYPTLTSIKKLEDVGFSTKKLSEIDLFIENEIRNGFPGAALIVIKNGKIVKNTSYGYAKKYNGSTFLKQPQKMKRDTMFDVASNTKMYAVNYALQKLVSEGKINLNHPIQHYIPEFNDLPNDVIKEKNTLQIVDLLHHMAGFPSSVHYYNPEKAGELYSQDRKAMLDKIIKTPLQYIPGTNQIYSDIDYMLLGFIIERVTGQQLDQYVENNIYKPLGLKHTVFTPLKKGFKEQDFAATELNGNTRDGYLMFPNMRTYTLQGEVHDENAYYSMGGISGHAGLFSNTHDLAVLLQVMLNDGGYGNTKLFDKETIDVFTTPSELNPTFGLGWRLNGDESMNWMFSEYAGDKVIGHTGWTGTITVIDRENHLAIALLTNKKHSAVIDHLVDSNWFYGDMFSISTYGSVISKVYEALQ